MYYKHMLAIALIIGLGIFLYSCESDLLTPENMEMDSIPGTTYMPASPQREGDPVKGKEILLNGGYIGSGIPFDIYKLVLGDNNENVLNRSGENASIGPNYTAFTHKNGTKIVSANCMQCHGGYINGEYIIGLGNINQDFTSSQLGLVDAVDLVLKNTNGEDSKEWDAYEAFSKSTRAIADWIVTKTVGANPADRIFAVLAAHRDKNTLEWHDSIPYEIPNEFTEFTDVPPWWVLKKKHQPLYTGTGGGDWAKLFMAASTLTLKDAEEADAIDEDFVHVMAYLKRVQDRYSINQAANFPLTDCMTLYHCLFR